MACFLGYEGCQQPPKYHRPATVPAREGKGVHGFMDGIGAPYRKSQLQERDAAGGKESGNGHMKGRGIVAAQRQEAAKGDKQDVQRRDVTDQGNTNEQRVQERLAQALEELMSALVPNPENAGFQHRDRQQNKK